MDVSLHRESAENHVRFLAHDATDAAVREKHGVPRPLHHHAARRIDVGVSIHPVRPLAHVVDTVADDNLLVLRPECLLNDGSIVRTGTDEF